MGYILLSVLVAVNLRMAWRVWQAPVQYLQHKGMLMAWIWLMPVLGAVMARSHLHHYVPGEAYRRPSRQKQVSLVDQHAPEQLVVVGIPAVDLSLWLEREQRLPRLNSPAMQAWLSAVAGADKRAEARQALEQAWLLHLRDALGSRYRLFQSPGGWLLSAWPTNIVAEHAALLLAVRDRVWKWLGALAPPPSSQENKGPTPSFLTSSGCLTAEGRQVWGRLRISVLSFDNPQDLAHYLRVSCPAACTAQENTDESVVLNDPLPHLVSTAVHLRSLEPMMVREWVRLALSDRLMPAWLSHGLAEHASRQLSGDRQDDRIPTHLLGSFWDESEIQAFWSGQAFAPQDERYALACSLACLLVDQLSSSPGPLWQFAAHAACEDAGAEAAREMLGIDLGALAAALLGHAPQVSWSPKQATVV